MESQDAQLLDGRVSESANNTLAQHSQCDWWKRSTSQHRFDVFKPERRRFRWNCSIRSCAAGRATDSIWRPTAQRRDGNQIVVSIYHQIVGLSLHSLYYTAHTTYIRSSTFNQKTLHGADGVVGPYTTQNVHTYIPSFLPDFLFPFFFLLFFF